MQSDSVNVSRLIPSANDEDSALRDKSLLRAFGAISKVLNLDQPLNLTLDLIAEKVAQTMGHKYCAVYLLEEETGSLLLEGSHGFSREYIEAVNTNLVQNVVGNDARASSGSVTAFKTRMPIHVKDITVDTRFEPWQELALSAGYTSVVSLPLIFRGEPIGVLNCYDEPRDYSEDQVEALMTVAEQAASAVGIARMVLRQQRDIERLDAANRFINAQHAVVQRSKEVHEALTAILLEDRSLHEMSEVLSGLLRSPVALQDEQLNVLSQATMPGRKFAGVPPQGDHRRRIDESAIAELRETGRARRIELVMRDGSASLLIATRVAAGENLYGYLSVLLENDSEEDLYQRTLEQASTVYALYMMKQRAAHEAESRIRASLLADLLTGRASNEAEAREWARYLKLDFASGSYRVLTANVRSSRTSLEEGEPSAREIERARRRLEALVRGFSSRFGPGTVAPIGDCVATLIHVHESKSPGAIAERLIQVVLEDAPDLSVRAGVSSACLRPSDLSKRCEETVALVDLAERLESPMQSLCYDDWKAYGLLIRASDREDIRSFASEMLGPLLTTPDGNRLIGTLQAYFESSMTMTRAAEILYVHPNTVKYRLQKAADLLCIDLNDLDDILAVKIALMVRNLNPGGLEA